MASTVIDASLRFLILFFKYPKRLLVLLYCSSSAHISFIATTTYRASFELPILAPVFSQPACDLLLTRALDHFQLLARRRVRKRRVLPVLPHVTERSFDTWTSRRFGACLDIFARFHDASRSPATRFDLCVVP